VLGQIVRGLSTLGLIFGIFTFLTKFPIYSGFDTFENAAFICVNSCVTLSGALPFMFVLTNVLNKPLSWLGAKIGIDSVSTAGFLSTLVSNAPTLSMMEKMTPKGVVLNAAFAASAACTVGSHLAFTMAYDEAYAFPMIVGKLISGISAVLLALLLYKKEKKD
jgi:ethanolamine transporter